MPLSPEQIRYVARAAVKKRKVSPKSEEGRRRIEAVGHELKVNEPAIVGHTREKFGAKRAEAQRTAILLSKARKAGVRIRKQ